jgi:hypothetical protein
MMPMGMIIVAVIMCNLLVRIIMLAVGMVVVIMNTLIIRIVCE